MMCTEKINDYGLNPFVAAIQNPNLKHFKETVILIKNSR